MMLDSLQAFSSQYCMKTNVAKCAVIVFGRTAPKPGTYVLAQGWVYNGQQVPLGQSFPERYRIPGDCVPPN
jgi:hypothetical protein